MIEAHPSTLDVILSDPITLPCRATGSPRPTISWQKEGLSISTTGNNTSPYVCVCVCVSGKLTSSCCASGGSFTVLPNGSLHVSKASVSDSGTYMCVAQNPAGTALGKTRLKVQGGGGVNLSYPNF